MLRIVPVGVAVAALLTGLASAASANDELMIMENNPNNWSQPAGDYANTRYSELDQINKEQRRRPAGRLDVLDRRAARPRGRARWSSAT